MTATGEQQEVGEINRLLVRLTRFLLRNSAEARSAARNTTAITAPSAAL